MSAAHNAIEEEFLREVWEALKGDHNDLRKEQIILLAFREAVRAASTALYEALKEAVLHVETLHSMCPRGPARKALLDALNRYHAALAAASPSQTGGGEMADAMTKYTLIGIRHDVYADIAAERQRQIESEGWTPEHDDGHRAGEMATAAAVYCCSGNPVAGQQMFEPDRTPSTAERLWPWDWKWFKPKDRRHNLIRAAALIVAEIERLDRAALQSAGKE